jgi:hypothetical protein
MADFKLEYMRSRKATKRSDGDLRYDLMITHAAGLDEIAFVILRDFNNDETKLGRMVIFDAVARFIWQSGGLNDESWDDIPRPDINRAVEIARRWFPELVVEVSR